MKYDAIKKVTVALQLRLKDSLKALDEVDHPEVFIGPLDDRDSRGAHLILFLYRICPNGDLRNSERRVLSAAGTDVEVFQNSLPLNLHYLLTVGTTFGSEQGKLSALGLAMQTLQADPVLTGPSLETTRVSLEPLSTDQSSRIWNLFPNVNYRTSVGYFVSPVWIDPAEPEESAEVVVDGTLRAGVKPSEVAT